MPAARMTTNLSYNILHRHAIGPQATKPALLHTQGTTSYGDLSTLAHKAAYGMRCKGVGVGDRVMIALPDGPNMAASIFGACHMGAIAVMVNAHEPERVDALAREVGAALVIGNPQHGHTDFSRLIAGTVENLKVRAVLPNEDAIFLYSGGSTSGRQKIVRVPHGAFTSATQYLTAHMGYNSATRTLSVPRLSFGYATGMNLFFPLAKGGTAILDHEWPTPERIFALAAEHQASVLVNTPAFIRKMLDYADSHPVNGALDSVRFMTSAGEPLTRALYQRWAERFPSVALCDALGFAEHWHFLTFNGPVPTPGTIGPVIPPLEARVCDEAGKALSTGEIGYLHVRGPAMANGYYNDPAATAAAFRDGWFVPGDLAQEIVGQDGVTRLAFHGRADNNFKVSGRWVSGNALANVIARHPAVAESVVLPYQDGTTTKPGVVIAIRDDAPAPELEALQTHLRSADIPPYQWPQRLIVQQTALPRMGHNKLDLAQLKAQLQGT